MPDKRLCASVRCVSRSFIVSRTVTSELSPTAVLLVFISVLMELKSRLARFGNLSAMNFRSSDERARHPASDKLLKLLAQNSSNLIKTHIVLVTFQKLMFTSSLFNMRFSRNHLSRSSVRFDSLKYVLRSIFLQSLSSNATSRQTRQTRASLHAAGTDPSMLTTFLKI